MAEALTSLPLESVRTSLIEWYESDHRSFPWRATTDPYRILVSEVMSQQTQLERVEAAYHDFLERWPTVEALADTDQSAVVGFWSAHSLGYNNRAKYLHTAANQLCADFDGDFPTDPETLQQLQGVGPYTANAVASFAFNNGDAVVDTNVKRVYFRLFEMDDDDREFERIANECLPENDSRVWNNAIMELGAVACQKTPRCDSAGCPWREHCHAYQTGDFTAPDVPTQPSFEGSRRQLRGRVVSALSEFGQLELDALGPRVRVDYTPEGTHGRSWLRDLLADLETDGLVALDSRADGTYARLRE